MSRRKAEDILNDMRDGRISEYEAERKLSQVYNDGVPFGVHNAVRDCNTGWKSVTESAGKVDNEYREQEYREQQRKEEEEENLRHQERLHQEGIERQQQEEQDYPEPEQEGG